MTSVRDSLREDARLRILRLLNADPHLTQRELAKRVGLSAGAIHYVLNALAEKGFVKLGNFTSAHDKRRYAYLLTASGISEKSRLTRRFLARKISEARMLEEEIAAICEELETIPSEAADFDDHGQAPPTSKGKS